MITKALTYSCLAFMLLSSCKKEITPKTQPTIGDEQLRSYAAVSNFAAGGTVDTAAHWYGSYAGFNGPYADVPDSQLIKNGIAKVPRIGLPYLFSNVSLHIPAAHIISGDSLMFEAAVKNTYSTGFYNFDIVLQIVGSLHAAELHFVGDAGSQQYNQLYVGDARVANVPQLNLFFDSLKTVRFVLKDDEAKVYVDSQFIYKLNYGAANRIGTVNFINVAGKGIAIVNKVRLLNSYTRDRILLEDFNTNGKSNTLFFR